MIQQLMTVLLIRIQRIHAPDTRERGDSPVPTAIIIAGLAVLAAAVVAWAVSKANGFMSTAPGP